MKKKEWVFIPVEISTGQLESDPENWVRNREDIYDLSKDAWEWKKFEVIPK